MKRLSLASCAALLVLAPALAFGQSRPAPAGGGSSAGTASPRGGDSGGSTSTSSSSGSTSSGSATARSGGSYGSPVGGGAMRDNWGAPRSYSGPRSGEATATARPRTSSASVGQAVPASERPRGDRPVYGQATPRRVSQGTGDRLIYGASDAYYPYYGYYGYYSYYDPFYWSSCGWSYGWGWPYCGGAWGSPYYGWGTYALPMSLYSGYWYGYAGGAAYTTPTTGSVKLKVKPKEAEVYVDGTFYGKVDEYDGAFQHLNLPAGTHKLEIRASGYQTLVTEIRVLPGKSVTYPGELKPAK